MTTNDLELLGDSILQFAVVLAGRRKFAPDLQKQEF